MSQKYWQHFLIDEDVLAHIAQTVSHTAQKLWCDRMIEIWPGEWVLTKLIVDEFDHVTLYEIDERMRAKLYPIISGHPDAKIVWGDVLESPSLIWGESWGTKERESPGGREVASTTKSEDDGGFAESSISITNTLVVGNLPYYITSPILRKFFEVADLWRSNQKIPEDDLVSSEILWENLPKSSHYPWWVFLVQKEVAEKIASNARKKSFLRWIVNYIYDVEYMFTVWPQAFDPPPKVDSAVFCMTKRVVDDIYTDRPDYIRMMTFLDIVSWLKRKTLGKIWKMRSEFLEDFVLPDGLRSKRIEELEWSDMCEICEMKN